MSGRSLVETVEGALVRTYGIPRPFDDIAAFVIGDRGVRELYVDGGHASIGATLGGARTLVRHEGGRVHATVYLPDDLVRRLEAHPPQRGLGDRNVDEFATLVEEIDHLLLLADRARTARRVSLLELEWNANVSKYLLVCRFAAGARPRLDAARRLWVRRRLFDGIRYTDPDPEVRDRYREASRLAVQWIDRTGRLRPARRLRALRRFFRADLAGRTALLQAV